MSTFILLKDKRGHFSDRLLSAFLMFKKKIVLNEVCPPSSLPGRNLKKQCHPHSEMQALKPIELATRWSINQIMQ